MSPLIGPSLGTVLKYTLAPKYFKDSSFFKGSGKISRSIIYAADRNCTYNIRKSGFNSCNILGEVGGLTNKADLSPLESECVPMLKHTCI